jgi:hypothetical protein
MSHLTGEQKDPKDALRGAGAELVGRIGLVGVSGMTFPINTRKLRSLL